MAIAILAPTEQQLIRQPPPRLVHQRFYRPELDCLRFLAFLGVYFFHIFPSEPSFYADRHIPFGVLIAGAARAGSFGVDLFFLLSAYLITELLLREKDEFGAVHLKHFYARRILRIWPLYFLTLLIGLALCRIDMQQKFPASYTVAFLVLSGNWMVSLVGFTQSVLNPLWSVSFEEQFYLLWPMLVAKSRRVNALLVTGGIMTLIASASRIILWKYARPGDTAIFTNTLARLDPLALGVVSAAVMHGRHLLLRWWVRVGFLGTGITILLLAGHFYHMNWSFLLIGYPAMAVGVWFLFMTVFQISFAPAWLRYLGKISYGLYALHMLALYFTDKMLGGYARNWGKFFVFWWLGLALTITMAALSYNLFEARFLRLKERCAFIKSRPA